jgi:hypothetical protein
VGRCEAIGDLLDDGLFIGGELEFDLSESNALPRSTEDVHDIVVDLPQSSIAVIAKRQTLADGLERNDLAERLTSDDTSGDPADAAWDGVSGPRPGHLGPFQG